MIRDISVFQSQEFIKLCVDHQVNKLYVFGSIATGSDNENSDVDLLVEVDELDPIKRGKLILRFNGALIDYFGKSVDLLTTDSLKNPFLKKSLNSSKILVYSRGEAIHHPCSSID